MFFLSKKTSINYEAYDLKHVFLYHMMIFKGKILMYHPGMHSYRMIKARTKCRYFTGGPFCNLKLYLFSIALGWLDEKKEKYLKVGASHCLTSDFPTSEVTAEEKKADPSSFLANIRR